MPGLKLYWLGFPIVEVDDQPIKLETQKVLALLAFLSMNDGPQPREKLATLLWPEHDQSGALGNLRRNLTSLQHSLGGRWIGITRETLSFQKDPSVWIDADQFWENIPKNPTQEKSPKVFAFGYLESLRGAVLLSRGDFLSGLNLKNSPGFDEWQDLLRQKYQRGLLQSLKILTEVLTNSENVDKAIEYCHKWVEIDFYNEEAARRLIRLYWQARERGLALQQYEKFARFLKTELDQEPEPETKALYHEIKTAGEKENFENSPREGSSVQRSFSRNMPEPILETRFYIPVLREQTVFREQLINHLTEGIEYPVILISAPAGYGKTTLLTQWVQRYQKPVAWMMLEGGDNDPVRFLNYLINAIERAQPGSVTSALKMMEAIQPVPDSSLLIDLLNILSMEAKELVLVFDDYHHIHSSVVHDLVHFMLEHLPRGLRVVISTREDPPFSLSRLQVRNQVLRISAEALRFTLSEASIFFNKVMGLEIPATDVAVLDSKTEGWVAGLQLAALSLRDNRNYDEFMQTFSGSNRLVQDYLTEEVINNQPESVQLFLLRTSILKRLCAPLCDALLYQEKPLDRYLKKSSTSQMEITSAEIITYLEKSNIFLFPLDENRVWYRYHPLFTQSLQALSERFLGWSKSGELDQLNLRASRWYEKNHLLYDAIHHAFCGNDLDRVADLIEIHAGNLLATAKHHTLLFWLRALPIDLIKKRPRLAVEYARVLCHVGQLDGVEELFNSASEGISSGEEDISFQHLKGQIAAVQTNYFFINGEIDKTLTAARIAELHLPKNSDILFEVLFIHNVAAFESDLVAEAEEAWKKAVAMYHSGGGIALHQLSECTESRIYHLQVLGQLHKAYELCKDTLEMIQKKSPQDLIAIGYMETCEGEILLEWNKLKEAEDVARRSINHTSNIGNPNLRVIAFGNLARILFAAGKSLEASQILEDAEKIIRNSKLNPNSADYIRSIRILITYAQKKNRTAKKWLFENIPDDNISLQFHTEIKNLTLARVLISQGEVELAIPLLARLEKSALEGQRFGHLIQIYALEALADFDQGRVDRSLIALKKSLDLSYPDGYIRSLVELGEPLRKLLLTLSKTMNDSEDKEMQKYFERLITSF